MKSRSERYWQRSILISKAYRDVIGCGPSAIDAVQLISKAYQPFLPPERFKGLRLNEIKMLFTTSLDTELKRRIFAFRRMNFRLYKHKRVLERKTIIPLPLP